MLQVLLKAKTDTFVFTKIKYNFVTIVIIYFFTFVTSLDVKSDFLDRMLI